MITSILLLQHNSEHAAGPASVSCCRLPITVLFCLSFLESIYVPMFIIHIVTAQQNQNTEEALVSCTCAGQKPK